jgi:hypothetical protein
MQGNHPVVSIQVAGIHRAPGILIRRDLVLVPLLSSELEHDLNEARGQADVIIVSGDGEIAESIRSSFIEARGLDRGELMAAVHLERPSSVRVPRMPPINSRRLVEEINRPEGSLSNALLAACGLPVTFLQDYSEPSTIAAAQYTSPENAFEVNRFDSVDEVANGICFWWMCWCEPTDPGTEP